jgi:hypothetical protein
MQLRGDRRCGFQSRARRSLRFRLLIRVLLSRRPRSSLHPPESAYMHYSLPSLPPPLCPLASRRCDFQSPSGRALMHIRDSSSPQRTYSYNSHTLHAYTHPHFLPSLIPTNQLLIIPHHHHDVQHFTYILSLVNTNEPLSFPPFLTYAHEPLCITITRKETEPLYLQLVEIRL